VIKGVSVLVFLVTGSAVLSFTLSWRVKYVPLAVGPVLRYNLAILPLVFLGNVFLEISFVKAHGALKNLPLLAAGQTFTYYSFLLAFSVFLLGERVSVVKTVAGMALIAVGTALLGGSLLGR
jgi:hypothetical protein